MKVTGLNYYQDKDKELSYPLAKRMDTLSIRDCESYYQKLITPPGGGFELESLVVDLTIGETYFLRNQEQFDFICSDILPEIIERNTHKRSLKIWCAGCSIGAEPYTLSILLHKHFSLQLQGWDVKIKATDINRDFLQRAREGIYDPWAFRSTPEDFCREYFNPEGKRFSLRPLYRQGVEFQSHNLLHSPYPTLIDQMGSIDLLLCRNVLIYFDTPTIHAVLKHFADALCPGGYLVLGHSEINLVDIQTLEFEKGKGHLLNFYSKLVTQRIKKSPPVPLPIFDLQPIDKGLVGLSACPKHSVPQEAPLDKRLELIKSVWEVASKGDMLKTIMHLQSIQNDQKMEPLFYFYYGVFLEQLGRTVEAQENLEKSLYLDRKFALSHYYLGLILKKRGERKKAQKCFQNASKSLPEGGIIPEWEGMSYEELKKMIAGQMIDFE